MDKQNDKAIENFKRIRDEYPQSQQARETEKELARDYNNPETIKEHEEMQKFIKWVKKKEPDFYDKNEQHKRKK